MPFNLLKTDSSLSLSVCILCFSPLIILMIFYCTQSNISIFFLKWGTPNWKSTPDNSPWQRRGVEGNNHFFDLLTAVLVTYCRKCFHCGACLIIIIMMVMVIMMSPCEGCGWYRVFSLHSFTCYKAGFVTCQELNHFVKATCFIKIKTLSWNIKK